MRHLPRTDARSRTSTVLLVLLGLLSMGLPAAAGALEDLETPRGWSRVEKERFLATAEIVRQEVLDVGVTGSRRATLSDGRFVHDAHIQSVNERRNHFTSSTAHYVDFRDSYRYNIAAYRVSVLVGYDRVPVSVERRLDAETAAVTWWVDDVAMMETDRLQARIQPPDLAAFYHQMRQARVFAQLVHDFDLNTGNLLITGDWDLWVVDFTRSFRRDRRLQDESQLEGRIDRRFLEGMRSLTEEQLTETVAPYLTKPEIKALLERRDRIVEYYDERLNELGAQFVLCELEH